MHQIIKPKGIEQLYASLYKHPEVREVVKILRGQSLKRRIEAGTDIFSA